MKNLLIYINPSKQFQPHHKMMIEVQIDNSLDYWKPEDIIVATNFPYEYHGIKSIEVPDLINSQYPEDPKAIINSKTDVIIYLLENKIITGLTWFHDTDAFQVAPFVEDEYTEFKLEKDLGLVKYGIYPKRNLNPVDVPDSERITSGNIFFKPESLDIFKRILEKMDREKILDESAFSLMMPEIKDRVQIMNQTYNISARRIRANCANSIQPIRVVHFPPQRPQWYRKVKFLLTPKLIELIDEKFH